MRLEARTVLVTGGASGIGAGAARRTAAGGADGAIGQTLNAGGGLSMW
jgi:NAD(P)-dependent dehydrogenase (short-subunit alcohol dehydrogenase family)